MSYPILTTLLPLGTLVSGLIVLQYLRRVAIYFGWQKDRRMTPIFLRIDIWHILVLLAIVGLVWDAGQRYSFQA